MARKNPDVWDITIWQGKVGMCFPIHYIQGQIPVVLQNRGTGERMVRYLAIRDGELRVYPKNTRENR